MKKLVYSLILSGCSIYTFAQSSFELTYGESGDESAHAIEETNDNGFIIGGYSTSFSNGDKDCYLVKTDAFGSVQWSKTFGSSGDDIIYSIRQNIDDTYIVMGFIDGTNKMFTSKLDATGQLIFTKTYIAANVGFKPEVIPTLDGNYVSLSTSGITPNTNLEMVKYGPSGNIIWEESFGRFFGGGVTELPNGEFIIVASKLAGGNLNEIALIKTNSTGTILWSKSFGGSQNDGAYNVKVLSNGNFFISGSTWSNTVGNMDIVMMETDPNGVLLWAKNYGEAGQHYRSFSGASVSGSVGGFISMISNSIPDINSDMGILRVNGAGDVIWSKQYGGNSEDNCYAIINTSDNGFALVGYTTSFGSGNKDFYFVKTDSLGNTGCRATPINLTNSDWNPSIAVLNPTVYSPVSKVNETYTSSVVSTIKYKICSRVGIEENQKTSQFEIYPNPTNGNFEIVVNKNVSAGKIRIYNLQGKVIFQEQFINSINHEYNLSFLTSGMYIIHIIGKEVNMKSRLIIE